MKNQDFDIESAKTAYTIINSLLAGHEALSDLLVLMSHTIDHEVLQALTATAEWQNYLNSKRELEAVKGLIEKFTEDLKRLEQS